MRGKVDENMPIESAALLRAAGWECDTVLDEALGGAEDPEVGARCQAEGRVLFTLDLDFADIRAYPPSAYAGIVVFRPATPSRDGVLALLTLLIPMLQSGWVEHRLWIVEPGRVRVRESYRESRRAS
jgi:predicted nuclease of predicted toxin-antitoxin system